MRNNRAFKIRHCCRQFRFGGRNEGIRMSRLNGVVYTINNTLQRRMMMCGANFSQMNNNNKKGRSTRCARILLPWAHNNLIAMQFNCLYVLSHFIMPNERKSQKNQRESQSRNMRKWEKIKLRFVLLFCMAFGCVLLLYSEESTYKEPLSETDSLRLFLLRAANRVLEYIAIIIPCRPLIM